MTSLAVYALLLLQALRLKTQPTRSSVGLPRPAHTKRNTHGFCCCPVALST